MFIADDAIPFCREQGDRPQVLPAGSQNLAFIGQFCELPDNVVFTVEYSVRSAQVAVSALLGLHHAAVSSAAEGAVVVGGMSALSAAIFSIGIPHDSVLNYDQAIKADNFLIVVHGLTNEVERAKTLLQASGPMQLDMHLDATQPAPFAA